MNFKIFEIFVWRHKSLCRKHSMGSFFYFRFYGLELLAGSSFTKVVGCIPLEGRIWYEIYTPFEVKTKPRLRLRVKFVKLDKNEQIINKCWLILYDFVSLKYSGVAYYETEDNGTVGPWLGEDDVTVSFKAE